jgi:subtilase family serine protease
MMLVRRAGVAVLAILAVICAGCTGQSAPAARPGGSVPAAGSGIAAPSAGVPSSLLTPLQIRTAYDLQPLYQQGITGKGETIVIVDPFGSPTIGPDLRHFDAAFGLPAPPSFRVIQPAGPVPPFRQTSNQVDGAVETTLDVEWAHAVAPGASILLAETPTAEIEGATGFAQIVQAEEYAIRRHLGGVVSMSLGATEETFASKAQLLSFRSAFELAAEPQYRVTMVAATGDTGASGYTYSTKSLYDSQVVGWPASDPLVTAVGGTQLDLTPSGSRRKPDVAWSLGGGGLSSVFARPAYQNAVVRYGMRAIPDVSMDAACQSATAIYLSFLGARWTQGCGTSLAAPLFAAIVALADQVAGHSLGPVNTALYRMAAARDRGIVDVVSGSNAIDVTVHGVQRTVRGWTAGTGYDLASGLGTIDGRYFVPELAHAAG